MLRFVSFPEPAVFKNNRSSLSHAEFVEEAIQDFIESVRIVETNVLSRAADMFSFDLKSGYHHVESFEGHQTYLVFFSWKHFNSNHVKFYLLTVLPFGLSSAPHMFTNILKPLGGIRAFALLFFLTTDRVLKRILKCAVL